MGLSKTVSLTYDKIEINYVHKGVCRMAENYDLFEVNKLFILGRPIVSIFHNATNMYSIVRVKIQETNLQYDDKEIIVVGYFPPLNEEELYRFTGILKTIQSTDSNFKLKLL